MAEIAKPKVALFRLESDTSAQRLFKALSAFSEVKDFAVTNAEGFLLASALEQAPEAELFFVASDLVSDSEESFSKRILLFSSASTAYKTILMGQRQGLARFPYLNIEALALPDLMRLCHTFIMNRGTSGVINLIDKGALIVGERIHSSSSIGYTLDQVSRFIEEERPTLFHRANDLRQMISSLATEALLHSQEADKEHHSVDIQFSASPDKLVFTLRFPLGSLEFSRLPSQIINASSFSWFLAWQGTDILFLTEHTQFKEIEIKGIIFANQKRAAEPIFKSLIYQTTEVSAKGTNLLASPKSFAFSLISELQANKAQRLRTEENLNDRIKEEDSGAVIQIDPATRLKITQLEGQVKNLQGQLQTKETQVRQGLAMITEAKTTLVQKRSETLKLLKEHESNSEVLRKQVAEMEKKLAQATRNLAEAKTAKDASQVKDDNASAGDGNIKKLEREKKELTESLATEQKKFALFETKHQQLKVEILSKDKEIIELKQEAEKLKKEVQKNLSAGANAEANAKKDSAAAKGASAAEKELQAKVRELTGKEETYKQEIKKLNFKIENAEKGVKGAQGELLEKIKLLEKKLEAAKAKEIEQIKKIEELNQQIKKGAKAA